MWFSYQFPNIILFFLNESELGSLACVSQQLREDTRLERSLRKRHMITSVLQYFHFNENMFSLHRTFKGDFLLNIRRLFQFIPEWFQYITDHNISNLDMSFMEPRLSPGIKLHQIISDFEIPALVETILSHVSHNTTLTYCNFNLFGNVLTKDQVYEAVRHHPTLDQVELCASFGYYSPTLPMALYRVSDGFEWRHYPPSN